MAQHASTTSSTSHQRHWSKPLLWAIIILAFSIFYTNYLHNIIFLIIGIGRQIQPLSDFPWTCARIHDPRLETCEDMWLDHKGRILYAACSTTESRQGWNPGGNRYNASARSLTDHITALEIDKLDPETGWPVMKELKVCGYPEAEPMHLIAFDARRVKSGLRFWLINHKPVFDSTGEILDSWTYGMNSTVEIFDLDEEGGTLHYVKTISSEVLVSPNDLAVDDDGVGFVITNDHSTKTGIFRGLEMLYGSGNVVYCQSDDGNCRIVDPKGNMPNGVAKDSNGLFYVANSATGVVNVYQLEDGELELVDSIFTGYPLDNLSFDEDGSLFLAAFPDPMALMKHFDRPREFVAPGTVLTIPAGKVNGKWEVSKVVEDSLGEKLPSLTVAVHDVRSRRLFLGGVMTPFITMCEKQEHVLRQV